MKRRRWRGHGQDGMRYLLLVYGVEEGFSTMTPKDVEANMKEWFTYTGGAQRGGRDRHGARPGARAGAARRARGGEGALREPPPAGGARGPAPADGRYAEAAAAYRDALALCRDARERAYLEARLAEVESG
jgi:hypothetical protein